MKSPW